MKVAAPTGMATPHSSLHGSQLLRLLEPLLPTSPLQTDVDLSAGLAQLFDLSDSIGLANAHLKLSHLPFKPGFQSAAVLVKDFQRTQQAMTRSINASFDPANRSARIRLPILADPVDDDTESLCRSYATFYQSLQRQVEFSLQAPLRETRSALAELSPRLAKLALLDSTLHDMLSIHRRKFFALIPTLLEQFLAQRMADLQSAGTIERDTLIAELTSFHARLHGLALAEAEARSLPLRGLIEAINEETDFNRHD